MQQRVHTSTVVSSSVAPGESLKYLHSRSHLMTSCWPQSASHSRHDWKLSLSATIMLNAVMCLAALSATVLVHSTTAALEKHYSLLPAPEHAQQEKGAHLAIIARPAAVCAAMSAAGN